ncbi:unnamed protein product [Phaeothamnion confervicola]
MKLVRYQTEDVGTPSALGIGVVSAAGVHPTGYTDLHEFIADGDRAVAAANTAIESVAPVVARRLLAPLPNPGKMLFLGRIFHQFRDGLGPEVPPFVYARVASSICGPDDEIRMPGPHDTVLYEGELLAIIGRGGRGISASAAMDHVFGYTQVNDLTWTDWIHGEQAGGLVQITMCKNADTFCPMGPMVVTADEIDPANARCTVRVNGEVRSVTSTSDMAWSMGQIIEWLSKDMTLHPGDVIATGTSEAKPVVVGDQVEVEFDGLGILSNPVVAGWH